MNTGMIEKWIQANEPQGRTKLAAKAEVSVGTIFKILKHQGSPNLATANRLAKAMGVTLDELASDRNQDQGQ